ncbi:hypothetical protein RM844_29990 [Streptomyces sp. DSM 44915]|uniref:Uncharacterized protein n=1 Tax=Streptomyces chisholmiae TaxID=3075540 RepID=A0ABU2JZT7_9ACTN|nr:hypothetical protein [Streptomyces sp. DSM 44915]MDT0270511.1 hypothetical protein [Streptomyces sp. DSM 44915]
MSKQEDTVRNASSKRRLGLLAAVATAGVTAMAVAVPSHAASEAEEAGEAPRVSEVPQTGEELIEALTGLLPEGLEIGEAEGEGLDAGPDVYASLLAADDSGGTSIDLSVSRWATDDWRDIAGCQGFGEPREGFSCEQTELPDGSILSLVTEEYIEEGDPEEGFEPYHGKDWSVWLEGPGGEGLDEPGGRAVVVGASKDLTDVADPDAYVPPVDIEQLAEVAQAPVWQALLDEADARYGAPEEWVEEPASDIPAAELRDAFRSLAPEGLEITDGTDDEPGRATVLVDKGAGAGLVEITAFGGAQFEEPSELPADIAELAGPASEALPPTDEGGIPGPAAPADPLCDETELADGSWLTVCDWPASADDPIAMNWAAITYPDGTSVDITAYNVTDWEGSEPTGTDAVLSGTELAEIVVADEWRALFS